MNSTSWENSVRDPSPLPFVFYLGPFRFDSEIDIPELRSSTGSGEKAVTVRLGGVPGAIPDSVPVGICQVTASEFLLDIVGTARYYVGHGCDVRVAIVPGTAIADVTTYLLGSVFGALCHQNAMLPLHASAVELDGAVTAFVGDSGAGKSTLAACLQRRGHQIVSDDICLLREAEEGGAMRVIPVAGWLKLWNQSLEYLGEKPVEENRVFSADDKFRVFLPESGSSQPLLARVVFLSRATDAAAQPTLQPVPLLEAIAGLMEMTYAGYVPALAGQRPRIFQQCARVLQSAHAWRLTVPWGFDHMEQVLDLVESGPLKAGANLQS